jgi:hypothetical protein
VLVLPEGLPNRSMTHPTHWKASYSPGIVAVTCPCGYVVISCKETELVDTGDEVRGAGFGGAVDVRGAGSGGVVKTSPSWLTLASLSELELLPEEMDQVRMEPRCESVDSGASARATAASVCRDERV